MDPATQLRPASHFALLGRLSHGRSPASPTCARYLSTFLIACNRLGILVAMDKVDGPVPTLTFLSLELDATQQRIYLPRDKLTALMAELRTWASCTHTTKRELLSLIGNLAFAVRAVSVGHLFLRCLISLSTTVHCLHHRLRLGIQVQADITWWSNFPTWNGTAQFINPDIVAAPDLQLFTDASGHSTAGRTLVPSPMATPPTGTVHPVERAICHPSSRSHLG